MSDRTFKAACGCTLPLEALGHVHVCPPTRSREDLMRCGCGRRLTVITVCVRCRKEPDDKTGNCKCDDLTADE